MAVIRLIALTALSERVSSQFTEFTHGLRTFRVYTTPLHHNPAVAACGSVGMHLASIHSAGENSAISAQISQTTHIGLSDVVTEGCWRWEDGSAVAYVNWASGEPNGATVREDYGFMLPDGTWNDDDSSERPYVCATLGTASTAATATWSFSGRDWELFAECKTWDNAEAACVARGSHLASVHSGAENQEIQSRMYSGGTAHIGLNDKDQEGVWLWTNGGPYSYENWATGNPDNNGGSEHRVHMFSDGSWNDGSDSTAGVYICASDSNLTAPLETWSVFGHSFSYYPLLRSRSDANSLCSAGGMTLASIISAVENDSVKSRLIDRNIRGWIGLSDSASEGNFVWDDDSPVLYTNWATGEPNNNAGNEHLVDIDPLLGQWNDDNDDEVKHFFCSHPPSNPFPLLNSLALVQSVTTMAGEACGVMGGPSALSSPRDMDFTKFNEVAMAYITIAHAIVGMTVSTGALCYVTKAGGGNLQDGPAHLSNFWNPRGIVARSASSPYLYIADGNHAIRQLRLDQNNVTTISGDGTAGYVDGSLGSSRFETPFGMAVVQSNSTNIVLYTTEALSYRIRKINLTSRSVQTVVGFGGAAAHVDGNLATARLVTPYSLAVDGSDEHTVLYVADNTHIRVVNVIDNQVTTLGRVASGTNPPIDGPLSSTASFDTTEGVFGVHIDTRYPNRFLYFTGYQSSVIRSIALATQTCYRTAGNGTRGQVDGFGIDARFDSAYSVVADPFADTFSLYILETDQADNKIRKITSIPTTAPSSLSPITLAPTHSPATGAPTVPSEATNAGGLTTGAISGIVIGSLILFCCTGIGVWGYYHGRTSRTDVKADKTNALETQELQSVGSDGKGTLRPGSGLWAPPSPVASPVLLTRRRSRNQGSSSSVQSIYARHRSDSTMLHSRQPSNDSEAKRLRARSSDVTIGAVPIFRPEQIRLVGLLGQGNFATTHRGTLRDAENRTPSRDVAVKVPKHNAENVDDTWKELQVMASLGRHPKLLDFIGVVTLSNKICLVTELCALGSLDRLHTKFDLAQKDRFLRVAGDVAAGLAHLHTIPIVHRDIACRNLLMKSDGTVVIADYGLSHKLGRMGYYTHQGAPTAWCWMAPESFGHRGKFTPKSDVWMLGVTLWEMLQKGQVPYGSGANFRHAVPRIIDGSLRLRVTNQNADSVCITLVDACLVADEAKRPTAADIRQHIAVATRDVSRGPYDDTNDTVRGSSLKAETKTDDLALSQRRGAESSGLVIPNEQVLVVSAGYRYSVSASQSAPCPPDPGVIQVEPSIQPPGGPPITQVSVSQSSPYPADTNMADVEPSVEPSVEVPTTEDG